VAYLLQDRVFRYHGIPKDIVSDRDTRFNSNFWRGWARQYGIRLSMSTAYHPESDGQTKRVNAVFEDTLRHFIGPYQNDWDSWVCMAEFAMNDAWNNSVRNTPFMLNYGQHPNTPMIAELQSRNPAVHKFVGKWDEQLQRAKVCLQKAQDRMRYYADQKRRPAT
jgi:transposase InsO family protein